MKQFVITSLLMPILLLGSSTLAQEIQHFETQIPRIQPESLSISIGDSKHLRANFSGKSDRIRWSSASPDIANVDRRTGIVTALKGGLAVIRAKRGPIEATCLVRVMEVSDQGPTPAFTDLKVLPDQTLIGATRNTVFRKVLFQPFEVYAGQGESGLQDGLRKEALFGSISGLAVSSDGDTLYVCDQGNVAVRQIRGELVSTPIGSGEIGFNLGKTDSKQAKFIDIVGIASLGDDIIVADRGGHVLYRSHAGTLTLLAGTLGVSGNSDGIGTTATFGEIRKIIAAADLKTVIVVEDRLLRFVTLDGTVRSLSRIDSQGFAGVFTPMVFSDPSHVSLDKDGNLYFSDSTGLYSLRTDGQGLSFGEAEKVLEIRDYGIPRCFTMSGRVIYLVIDKGFEHRLVRFQYPGGE